MAFNHSDTDRIAVYPNRPPKDNGVSWKLEAVDSSMVSIFLYIPASLKPHHLATRAKSLL